MNLKDKIQSVLDQIKSGELELVAEHTSGGAPSLASGITDPVDLIDSVNLPKISEVEGAMGNVIAETEDAEIRCAIGVMIQRGLYKVVSGDCPLSAVEDVVVDVVEVGGGK